MIKEIIEGGWVSGWPEMLVAAIVAVCIFDLLQQLRQALKGPAQEIIERRKAMTEKHASLVGCDLCGDAESDELNTCDYRQTVYCPSCESGWYLSCCEECDRRCCNRGSRKSMSDKLRKSWRNIWCILRALDRHEVRFENPILENQWKEVWWAAFRDQPTSTSLSNANP